MKTLPPAFLIVAALAVAAPAQAAPIAFQATLSGLQEVPPNASPGGGTGLVTFDDALHTLQFEIDFADLLSPTQDAHIHCCAPAGVNAGVAIGFTPAGFPLGVTAGSFFHIFDLTDPTIYNGVFFAATGSTAAGAEAALVAGLFDGLTYLNIHTTQIPGGEIRGQLAQIPEPAALGLLLVGLAGLAARRRS